MKRAFPLRVSVGEWLWANGTFALCVVYGTVGESLFCLAVAVFLIIISLLLELVLVLRRIHGGAVCYWQVGLDVILSVVILTLLCIYTPWYIWGMYFCLSVLGINRETMGIFPMGRK